MSRRKRSPEEQARREKIRELLQIGGISSMEDIQNVVPSVREQLRRKFDQPPMPYLK